ncbi:MAG: DUF2273 domain-containing protein [Firmicutes bacterium]|jgi:uncharacterized membrane protein|nr:DUF2273 domain-containing protein [Bacillota bacterium]
MLKEFLVWLLENKGKVFGTIIGLLVGWIIIKYGVLRGLFVFICVSIGFFVGNQYDKQEEDITSMINRFLR